MKKRLFSCAVVLFLLVAVTGCATYLPTGAIYTEVKAPIATGPTDGTYSKVGTAMATSILGLVATGDASIRTAMANGGIKKIKYIDYEVRNILGIFGEYKTIVYGD